MTCRSFRLLIHENQTTSPEHLSKQSFPLPPRGHTVMVLLYLGERSAHQHQGRVQLTTYLGIKSHGNTATPILLRIIGHCFLQSWVAAAETMRSNKYGLALYQKSAGPAPGPSRPAFPLHLYELCYFQINRTWKKLFSKWIMLSFFFFFNNAQAS